MNTPIMCTSLRVRKGSWTEEEDSLLRKCIHKYGEGKWHLVPARAGLNRCRKSCRLRWLNYLRPHIKKGDFEPDEVDLIFRLHKLLGNRWSLIAGRLPGRTANDVKNYWNTHSQKKLHTIAPALPLPLPPPPRQKINNECVAITKNEIVRPQPRNFSRAKKNISHQCNNKSMITNTLDKDDEHNKEIVVNIYDKPIGETTSSTDDGVQWWTNLLENCNEIEEEIGVTNYEKTPTMLLHDEISPPLINGGGNSMQLQGQSDDWDDFSIDIDLWNLLD